MALFRHILDFKRSALARWRDRRKAKRHLIAAGFPLRAVLTLTESSRAGASGARFPGTREWSGTATNISTHGINILLPVAAQASRGERTTLTLSFDGHELQLPCEVAYFRTGPASASCGLALRLEEPEARKAYLQLLEAVSLGANLTFVKTSRRDSHPRDLRAEHYISGRKARLTTWRDFADQLDSFELVIGDHCLRGEANRPALEIFSRHAQSTKIAWSARKFGLSSGIENDEVRQLYRWVALNLPKPVPADVRQLMRFFAKARTDWKPPSRAIRAEAKGGPV